MKIKRLVPHDNFNNLNLENDIALIELEEPLDLDANDYVKNICLPEGEEPSVGTKCFLAGWGYTEEDRASAVLKEVDLKIAATKLGLMGGELEILTEEQINYLDSWEHGTS